jgi:hypothetical protein
VRLERLDVAASVSDDVRESARKARPRRMRASRLVVRGAAELELYTLRPFRLRSCRADTCRGNSQAEGHRAPFE